MCSPKIMRMIEDIIEMKMIAEDMFTAFDVTLDLQQRGVRKRHRELRNDIKRVADATTLRYQYQSSLVNLKGINARAMLYYKYGADIDSYQPTIRANQSQANGNGNGNGRSRSRGTYPMPVHQHLSSIIPAQYGFSNVKKSLDGRSRVCVPARLSSSVGFEPGDKVHFIYDHQNNSLLLTKNAQTNTISNTQAYTVEKYRNVRITLSKLQAISTGLASQDYLLSISPDGISIVPA